MKTIILITCFSLQTILLNAQFTQLGESKSFEEPATFKSQVIQLRNGNTLFFRSVNDDLIEEIYDSTFHLIASPKIKPSFMDLWNKGPRALFEINNNAVFFQSSITDQIPRINRVVFDGNSGEIVEDKVQLELKKTKVELAYDKGCFDAGQPPKFIVVQNPETEAYSIVIVKCYDEDSAKEIEIVNFDKLHNELNRTFFPRIGSLNYSKVFSCNYVGGNKICIFGSEFNFAKEDKKSEMFYSIYNITDNSFVTRKYDLDQEFLNTLIFPDWKNQKMYFLAQKNVTPKSKVLQKSWDQIYQSKLSVFDTKEMKFISKEKDISSETIFGTKYPGFNGIPQDLAVHDDGSFTILYEEITIEEGSSNSRASGIDTRLGNIIVANFNPNAELGSISIISKQHRYPEYRLSPYYNRRSEHYTEFKSKDGHEYKYVQYINASKGYLFMNDIESNESRDKTKAVFGIQECHGFFFNTNEESPKREFLFGKPLSNRENNIGFFGTWQYDEQRKILCTLKLKMEGRNDKTISLVWFKVE